LLSSSAEALLSDSPGADRPDLLRPPVVDRCSCNICCRIVTVQTKSEPLYRACREYEQRHFIVSKCELREFAQLNFVIALRQIVAKSQ
jgi:hypothetical protein